MLRITAGTPSRGGTVLRLDGRLAGPWVGELRSHCDGILAGGTALTLDLSGVSFVAESGLHLLAALARDRVALTGSSPFVAAQLRGHRAATGAPGGETP